MRVVVDTGVFSAALSRRRRPALDRCKSLWHVGPPGSWDRIRRHGFQTAEQLIRAADLPRDERAALLIERRREPVVLTVDGEDVVLRDQGRLFGRTDLSSILADDFSVADWVGLLNRRVYVFADVGVVVYAHRYFADGRIESLPSA